MQVFVITNISLKHSVCNYINLQKQTFGGLKTGTMKHTKNRDSLNVDTYQIIPTSQDVQGPTIIGIQKNIFNNFFFEKLYIF